MADRYLVGVAWPYANGVLHLGHIAGCYLPPDIFARYQRMAGHEVLMVSGSDEHGTPITVRAEDEDRDPSEITDHYHEKFLEIFDDLAIGFVSPDRFAAEPDRHFGFFTRTGTDNHREVVHDLFETLRDEGYIYEDTQDALYCEDEDRYLADRYVEGVCPHCGFDEARGDQCDDCGKTFDAVTLQDPVCKSCGATPVVRTATHLFFELSAFEDPLREWVTSEKEDVFRDNVYDFTMNWLTEGLHDRAITRDITWGVPVPEEGWSEKRIYVWFEAVIGYLSATIEWAETTGDPDAWRRFWQDPDCRVYNFLAKDNIPFHTIIWPAMLIGLSEGKGEDYNLPYDVPANEYLNMAGEKFSTSRGIGGTVPEFLDHYPADALRFYLTRVMPEKRDADFRVEEFVRANNDELVATLGNFIHRALTFTDDRYDAVPEPGQTDAVDDKVLAEDVPAAIETVGTRLDRCEFKDALARLMELARVGNRYFDRVAPWDVDDEDRLATVLHTSLTLSRALTILMAPFVPDAAERAWSMLGEDGSVHDAAWQDAADPIDPGQALGEVEPLFEKLEVPDDLDDTEPDADETDTEPADAKEDQDMVSFQEFQKIDLQIGTILDVEDHPDADKLYLIDVDLGDEQRQLVAGLRPYMDQESLEGEQCVVVANMEPTELRGERSEGMLLAAEHDEDVVLIQPGEQIPDGAQVK